MKGDFTRWTFDKDNRFTRVLMQQGRVQLDADWNEQAAILLHYLRALAEDLIGPFGGPAKPDGSPGDGFKLDSVLNQDSSAVKDDFRLLPGRYWVGGMLVENPTERTYKTDKAVLPQLGNSETNLLYLDVWEQLVTPIQDDRIREVALGEVDTAVRAKVVWRVRELHGNDLGREPTRVDVLNGWSRWVVRWQPEKLRGMLKAQAKLEDIKDDEHCHVSPEARYTGENQLYRVEIHTGGTADEGATFKWSRENGSVVFPIRKVDEDKVTLDHLGRDGRFGLERGSWVEALDDDSEEGARPLLQVVSLEEDRLQVTLSAKLPELDVDKHAFLRRWDHREGPQDGTVPVQEEAPLSLEDGIIVWFEKAANGEADHTYRSGDYWLIPARTATGDVEWPGEPDAPEALPPHGVEHRYAPLGLVTIAGGSITIQDCRSTFKALTEPPAP
jgi:uncharacterized protein DUF6519